MYSLRVFISSIFIISWFVGCATELTKGDGHENTDGPIVEKKQQSKNKYPIKKDPSILLGNKKGSSIDKGSLFEQERNATDQKSITARIDESEKFMVDSNDTKSSVVQGLLPIEPSRRKTVDSNIINIDNTGKVQNDPEVNVESLGNEGREIPALQQNDQHSNIRSNRLHASDPDPVEEKEKYTDHQRLGVLKEIGKIKEEFEVKPRHDTEKVPSSTIETNNREAQSVQSKVDDTTRSPDHQKTSADQNLLFEQSPANHSEDYKREVSTSKNIGLSDVFSNENLSTGASQKSGSEVILSPSNREILLEDTNSVMQLGFSDPASSRESKEQGSNLRVGLSPKESNSDREDVGKEKLVILRQSDIEYEEGEDSSSKRFIRFKEGNELGPNNLVEKERGRVGTGDTIDNVMRANEKDEKETVKRKRNSVRNYGGIRSFLGGQSSSGMNTKASEKKKKYEKLRDWTPRDQNRTDFSKEGNAKQFKQALEWIRKKGRLNQ